MRKSLVIAAVLTIASLLLGALLIHRVNFGIARIYNFPILLWLWGPGLPTSAVVTGTAALWTSLPLPLYLWSRRCSQVL